MADNNTITSFNLHPGRILARKYEVLEQLGSGWEGEVHLIKELSTGIVRTAKLFFPKRNIRDKATKFYAKKLHTLRHCPITIQYSTQEVITVKQQQVSMLISEYVEGMLLSQFIAKQPGKRMTAFQALHLLHALARGMECIHSMKEYHGDLHSDNIIVQRYGLTFELKLIDMFNFGAPSKSNIHADTVDMIHILYECIGGKKHYASQPKVIKDLVCGLKRTMILKKFRSAGELRQYIENLEWTD